MGLLSLFSRSKSDRDAATETDTGDSVARARTRARQRLLGAVVLVGIGIVGFPILFETQPRPIPVDVPIEIPPREGVAPLKLPSERGPQAAPAAAGSTAGRGKSEPMITESAAEAGRPVANNAGTAAEPKLAEQPGQKPAQEPRSTADAAAAAKADSKATDKTGDRTDDQAAAQAAEAARARALLDGKPTSKEAAPAGRYIVQIGAFADPALARATRLKVERLGLTTYTHVAKTADGDRTRVRVGPVASRDEAEKIAARIKAAGLPTAILTL